MSKQFGGPQRNYGGGGGGARKYPPKSPGKQSYMPASSNTPMPASVQHAVLRKQKMQSGREGRPIELVANFFRLITTGLIVYHYDVVVSKTRQDGEGKPNGKPNGKPTQPANNGNSSRFDGFIRKITPKVLEAFVAQNATIFTNVHYVHDGAKNLYSTRPLQLSAEDQYEVEVNNDGRFNRFEVRLNQVAQINLSEVDAYYSGRTNVISQHVITVYDQILRFVLEKLYLPYQKCFYDVRNQRMQLNNIPLYDLVHGFIASVQLTEFGLALNLHPRSAYVVAAKFKTLDQFVETLLGSRARMDSLTYDQVRRVNRVVGRLRVYTKHMASGERGYSIDKIVRETPYEYRFDKRDGSGERISVSDYFTAQYPNVRPLKRLPLVKCGQNYLPMELCYLAENQFVSESIHDAKMQTEQLLKSKRPPNEYFSRVIGIVEKTAAIDPALLRAFGIELTTKPVKLSGRVLPLPGKLNTDGQFYRPAKVEGVKWGLFSFDESCSEAKLGDFVDQLLNSAARKRLSFTKSAKNANEQYGNVHSVAIKDISQIGNVFKRLKTMDVNFVYVAIPDEHNFLNSELIYKQIKLQADTEVEIESQCIKGSRLKDIPGGYFDNFLLKVNGKLGGINTVADPSYLAGMPLKMVDTMVVGIDVNHPGATEKIRSSVAAAVGTRDAVMAKYSSSIRVQQRERVEIVQQIDVMIEELLTDYHKSNGKYPKNLFVFRDGVSEGQFTQVEEKEIPKIRSACAKVQKDMKLTVVVVQKRHHTRFASTQLIDTPNGRSKTYNVPAGTVVDTVIVEPSIENFLLNSHFSQLGTSKPSKYIVLVDELNLTSDQIEKFCFFACHNCVRTKNTISIPTAVRYADLCAYRAKGHIEAKLEERDRDGASTTASSSTDRNHQREGELIAEFNDWVRVSPHRRINLYYC